MDCKGKIYEGLYRDEMTEEQEKAFVEDLFTAYENEGFAPVFWSQDSYYMRYAGKPFKVLGRTPLYDGGRAGADLECLPMWEIRFEDGTEISAYPDEIIPSEMRDNGCPEEYLPANA